LQEEANLIEENQVNDSTLPADNIRLQMGGWPNGAAFLAKRWSDDSLTTTGANDGEHRRRENQAIRLRNTEIGWRRTVANEQASLSHGRGRWFETSIAHSQKPISKRETKTRGL
jgi:hypothetical protein